MSIISDLSYNYHKGSAEAYVQRKFNSDDKYNDFKSNYTKELDAFYNAYAEAENYVPDGTRYAGATDRELASWYLGKQTQNENPGGWQDDLFDKFFTGSSSNYSINPEIEGLLDDNFSLSPYEKNKIKAALMSNDFDSPLNAIKAVFGLAASTLAPVDPLIIDLDGDGIETTGLQNGFMMDHQSDGFAELSSWVDTDDGIIVHDKNNNGIIDNGNEIFGDNYIKENGTKASSGFDALSDFFKNSIPFSKNIPGWLIYI